MCGRVGGEVGEKLSGIVRSPASSLSIFSRSACVGVKECLREGKRMRG